MYKDDGYDEDDDDINIGNTQYAQHSGPELSVAIILSRTTITKMPLIKKMAGELMKQTRFVKWNYRGILTHPPKYKGTPHINLARMLDIMLTKTEKASPTEMGIILNIIKPFYRNIKPHVKNTHILKQFDTWDMTPSSIQNNQKQRGNLPPSITYQTL